MRRFDVVRSPWRCGRRTRGHRNGRWVEATQEVVVDDVVDFETREVPFVELGAFRHKELPRKRVVEVPALVI